MLPCAFPRYSPLLLAVMAGFYALWHGPEGLKRIAGHAHAMACRFAAAMRAAGREVRHDTFFDTVTIEAPDDRDALIAAALEAGCNLRSLDGAIAASFDETSTADMLERLFEERQRSLCDLCLLGNRRLSLAAFVRHPARETTRSKQRKRRKEQVDVPLARSRLCVARGYAAFSPNLRRGALFGNNGIIREFGSPRLLLFQNTERWRYSYP